MKKKEEAESAVNEKDSKEQSSDSKSKKTKELKRTEAETRNKIYRLAKPYKDRTSKIERDIKSSEQRLREIENEMTSESFFKDSENVIKINKEFSEIKKKLDNLYHEWFINNDKIKEIEKVT